MKTKIIKHLISNKDGKIEDRLCPVCGVRIYLRDATKDGRLIGSCGDAFTIERWNEPDVTK